ncbi:GGDEF domain-containing protein [Peribacillus sp. SCS-37]|uniref:GGDEF domain-containing protein n=1 Tax=Paraperibacillus esterisolvens TaxID=3115296 RepID=UPI00390651F4
MLRDRLFTFALFLTSLAISIHTPHLFIEMNVYIKALALYWLFSNLYFHLRIVSKKGSTPIDYGITYSLSFGLFAGPFGLFIFEVLYRLTVYFNKKRTKTADPSEFLDTVYNIGSFTLNHSIAYYLYIQLSPVFHNIPFGFWIMMILLVTITSLLSDLYFIISFYFLGELKTLSEAIDFIKTRSILDIGKLSFTNGLLLLFLQEQKWDMLLSLFILNYLVSRSFISKAQSIQDKNERDKFEQMAYTDFLTGISNRAYMDKKMKELNQIGECIGIVVADIDHFKNINDRFNHAVGDKVIQHFALSLSNIIGTEDYLFRSGGEEFTLFLRGKGFEDHVQALHELLSTLEKSTVDAEFNNEQIPIAYTASFGLYYFKLGGQISMEKGYIFADQLLLQSKKLGRNRVSVKNGLEL